MSTFLEEAQLWVLSNKSLSRLIANIEASSNNDQEAALAMYHLISNMYHLPTTYDDITNKVRAAYEKRHRNASCVYGEMAVVNYIFKEENIKNNVLVALHTVYLKERIDIMLAAIKRYGNWENVPKSYYVYYYGTDIDAHILMFSAENGFLYGSGAVRTMLMERH